MHNYRPPAPMTSGSQGSRVKVCVARDQDFQDQIGSQQWFDLVNPEKVPISSVCLEYHMGCYTALWISKYISNYTNDYSLPCISKCMNICKPVTTCA